jgi:hypothetical protein
MLKTNVEHRAPGDLRAVDFAYSGPGKAVLERVQVSSCIDEAESREKMRNGNRVDVKTRGDWPRLRAGSPILV